MIASHYLDFGDEISETVECLEGFSSVYEGPGAVAGPGAAALHAHVLQVVAGGELAAGQRLRPLQVELLQDPQTRSLHPLTQRSAGACSTAVSGQGVSHETKSLKL